MKARPSLQSPPRRKARSAVRASRNVGARVGPGGHAVAVEPAGKTANLTRLRRIEGQVRGLYNMVEQERYCADVLVQVAAVQQALRAVSRELWKNHLHHCVTHAIQAGGGQAQAIYEELERLHRLLQR